jgi:hypothetical protein
VKQRLLAGLTLVALTVSAIYASGRAATNTDTPALADAPRAAPEATGTTTPLEFRELLTIGAKLAPSPKAVSLSGQRVAITGYMAQMELAPKGAFYLASRPVQCDEAGAGTADLPPDSVLVLTDALRDKVVPFVAGPLELSGVFEVGNRTDAEGRVSGFRLTLDAPLGERLAQLEQPAAQHSH